MQTGVHGAAGLYEQPSELDSLDLWLSLQTAFFPIESLPPHPRNDTVPPRGYVSLPTTLRNGQICFCYYLFIYELVDSHFPESS
uniref:Uncharacterized protein n=1 Tax=Anguilla anguilla TaxID=7936 RepID=A0A0E9RAL5_ANGAN